MSSLIYGTQGNLSYGQATASTVQLLPASGVSPTVGEKLILSLNIVGGSSVAGYEAAIKFDTSALRHVESVIGDYLPTGAFFVPPVVAGNLVKLAATSLAGESNGNGTLATITFEVQAVKASTLTLSHYLMYFSPIAQACLRARRLKAHRLRKQKNPRLLQRCMTISKAPGYG